MDTSFTNSKEQIAIAPRDETDWSNLTRAAQIRNIELEGYVVLPDLLSPETLEKIREELRRLPMRSTDYSPHQQGSQNGPIRRPLPTSSPTHP